MIAGVGLESDSLAAAHRIASATGAKLLAPSCNRVSRRGRGRHPSALLPYPVDQAVAAVAGIRHLILVGSQEPIAFFAYPDQPSLMRPNGSIVHKLARPGEDVAGALAALAVGLAAPPVPPPSTKHPEPAHGPVTAAAVARAHAAL